MTIVIENGHGTDREAIVAEILKMSLNPHESISLHLLSGFGWFNRDVNLFMVSGELEIEVEGFPVSAHAGARVHIPAKQFHTLKASDDAYAILAVDTPAIDQLRRIRDANT
jgi:quercetin dioxygenase-like cupin family protein